MALATQCPHCQTTFRVAHDQLKLRAGLVRCGHCKEIFNGIEHLLPPPPTGETDASAATPAAHAEAAPPSPFAKETGAPFEAATETGTRDAKDEMPAASAETRSDFAKIDFDIPPAENATDAHAETASEPISETASEAASEPLTYAQTQEYRPADLLQRMTLLDFTRELPDSLPGDADEIAARQLSNAEDEDGAFDPHAKDALDEAIEDLQRRPWRSTRKKGKTRPAAAASVSDTEDEPGFVKRGRRRQRLGRKLRMVFGLGSFILLLTALAQGTYLFRNQIAGLYPQAKPALTQICGLLGCRIDLPAQIATVSIESSELQALANGKDMFVLTTLLRNYSSSAQEWPYIELTLNDRNEKPLLRRVFKPADYLNSAGAATLGFAANSERSVKLSFALSQIKASGYRVYLFYP